MERMKTENDMMRYKNGRIPIIAIVLLLAMSGFIGCRNRKSTVPRREENMQAKALLQGIWVDEETSEVAFKAKGDTIFYPDTTSMPAYFRIYGDSLILGDTKDEDQYVIVKQAAHIFWFKNQNGDMVKLVKSDNPSDALEFIHNRSRVRNYTEVVKRDTVVMYQGERHHLYVAINPTKYKVNSTSYNDDGVSVDNVYYDNIIHISIFKGAQQLFSRDFNKQMYAAQVPAHFLDHAVFTNMEYEHADAAGFHFNATLCIPDVASCYLVATTISESGKVKMELKEY